MLQVRTMKHELEACLEADLLDEETAHLIIDSALEALAEKLVKDDVFGPNEEKGLLDLFEDIINS